jgi:large subunit ribosomal protein L23
MDLTRVIVGQIVTEKTERLKGDRAYTVQVSPDATKVDIDRALRTYFGVEPVSVRVIRVRPKARLVGPNKIFTKRHRSKKAIVTLSKDSKPLDIANFKAS